MTKTENRKGKLKLIVLVAVALFVVAVKTDVANFSVFSPIVIASFILLMVYGWFGLMLKKEFTTQVASHSVKIKGKNLQMTRLSTFLIICAAVLIPLSVVFNQLENLLLISSLCLLFFSVLLYSYALWKSYK